jgi:hypothetical protein
VSTTELGRQPSRLPAANLASAFGTPDRSAALTGLLAPVWRADTSAIRTGPEVPKDVAPTAGSSVPAAADRDGSRPVTVIAYLPASLRDRLREVSAGEGSTYTELTLEAIDFTYVRLGELLETSSAARRPGSLFASSTAPRRRRHSEPQVQVSLRLIPSQLRVIDRLVDEHAAPSRSALVAAALQAHVPVKP